MTPNVYVLDVRSSDIPVVHEALGRLADFEDSSAYMTASETALHDALFQVDAPIRGLVALVEGNFAGCLIWEITFSSWSCTNTGRILDLYVSADMREGGVGKALLARLLEEARAHSLTRVDLWVRGDNERAKRFYEVAGGQELAGWESWRFYL
jgi:ribosomal protein S18 acetylase RimI-like enzyme